MIFSAASTCQVDAAGNNSFFFLKIVYLPFVIARCYNILMAKSKKIVVGNWKMNPDTPQEARTIFSGIKRQALKLKNTRTIICPPFVYLAELVAKSGASEKFSIGAQDLFFENTGAFTGEISPSMLTHLGINFVIVGHSERRALGDTDDIVNKKVLASVKAGLTTILCIGESSRDSAVTYLDFIKEQIKSGLARINQVQLKHIMIAYEPLWAIGKTQAMSPYDLEHMVIFIRRVIADLYGADLAKAVQVLYGGSVNPKNTRDLVTVGKVAGLLVGRESRDAKSFSTILTTVDNL